MILTWKRGARGDKCVVPSGRHCCLGWKVKYPVREGQKQFGGLEFTRIFNKRRINEKFDLIQKYKFCRGDSIHRLQHGGGILLPQARSYICELFFSWACLSF